MTTITDEPSMFLHTFPAAPESITSARRLVRALCIEWRLSDDVAEAIELVTSELTTNAYKAAHQTGDTFEVQVLRLSGPRVWVHVWDRSHEKPEQGQPAPDATGGRGLMIVSALALDWGVSPERGGKCVWAVL